MGLDSIFQKLRRDADKNHVRYARAQTRSATLAPYRTSQELLAAFRVNSELNPAQRDGLTVALISEYQGEPHSLWSALLLLAYEPMVRGFAARLRNVEPEEACGRILAAFLEVVAKFPTSHIPAKVALSLQRRVAEKIFDPIRRDSRTMTECYDETRVHNARELFEAVNRIDRLVDVARVIGADREETLDMLLATVVYRETMLSYVSRTGKGWKSRQFYKDQCARRRETLEKLQSAFSYSP